MAEYNNLRSGSPIEESLRCGAASLDSILRTEDLLGRPSRPPEHETEISALSALVIALANSPGTILQTLADKVLEILRADSAGLSLLTKDRKKFYWAAIAGAWRPHIGGGTPRDFGPCGDVLDRNTPMLFTHWERRYPYLSVAMPLADEGLLVPFYVNDEAVGTIWVIAHSIHRKFDAEDLRILESLSRFASAAYQAVASIDDLRLEIAAREKAQTELRELTDGLETQVRARTDELEQRNAQLAEARGRLGEEKLRLERSEAYMAEAQRLANTGSWHLSVRTGDVLWSQEFFAILGFDPDQTKASYRLFLERIYPDDRSRVDHVLSAAIREKSDCEVEYRLLLPGGLVKHVHSVGHCLATQSGEVEFIAAVMDITERKLAQEELRRSEAFLAEGQRLSRVGSFSWRVATDEITWSNEVYRIFELDPRERVTLQLISTRVHPDDIHLMNDMACRAQAAAHDFEYEHRLQMPDLSVKYLRLVAHGARDKDGRLEYIGAIQDVTQHRLSEDALAQARSELAHGARVMSLGELSASIAHEVNQPLSGIKTNASTCLRMLGANPPNIEVARETASRMIRDVDRASNVIVRLRGLFGKKNNATDLVHLNEVAEEVIALSLNQLQRNRVLLRMEAGGDLPVVTGDRVQLQQVVLNLLLNASDAMSAIHDRPRQLVIKTERDGGDRVRLSVQDAGGGIDLRNQDKIFRAFYSTKTGGMGIGLSVSRSIIESHQGRLWATANDGPGATFAFSIPCRVCT